MPPDFITEKLKRETASVWPLSRNPFAACSVAMKPAERLPQFLQEQGLALQLLHQAHSADYASCFAQTPASADAWIWTNIVEPLNMQNIADCTAFGIYTADCVPALLHTGQKNGPGALMHLGRRGIEQRLLEKCVRALMPPAKTESGSPKTELDKVQIWLGPSIGPCCYEVPTALAKEFCRRAGVNARKPHPQKREGKQMLDLALAVREQVLALSKTDSRFANIQIEATGPCTSCQAQRYQSNPKDEAVCYSYRRGHKKERIYTFVILPNPQNSAQ